MATLTFSTFPRVFVFVESVFDKSFVNYRIALRLHVFPARFLSCKNLSTIGDHLVVFSAEKDTGARLRSLKVVLKKLPSANLDILKYLIMHIAK